MTKPYPNEALTEVCKLLLEYGLEPEQVGNLVNDIPGEYDAEIDRRLEAAYERQQERDRDIWNDGADHGYREAMKDAGRGHLLR